MSTWFERNLPDIGAWHLTPDDEALDESEIAYLLNDIGPLLYVFGDHLEPRSE